MFRKSIIVLSLLAAASFNASACYTVFDRSNRVLYQGEQPPVDMSLPLHRALQARFPGGHMVFDQTAGCGPIAMASTARAELPGASPNTAVMGAGPATGPMVATVSNARAPAASSSPLLTDRRTAQSMNLPYRPVSGDIVVVSAQAASRVDLPTFNVVPSNMPSPTQIAASPIPNTAVMGAGPAPSSGTVITEMHNPPLTVVQRDGDTLISRRS